MKCNLSWIKFRTNIQNPRIANSGVQKKIRTIVCEHLDISEDLLMSKSRRQDIVYARQISMYLCKKHTNCNPKLIGSKIGNCNRATVVYSCEHIEEQIKNSKMTSMILKII